MKSTMTSVGMACLLILSSAAMQAQFSVPGGLKLPSGTSASGSTAQNAGLGAGLSDAQIGSGVKDALAVGTKRAVESVAKPGGYLDNAEIKILLPKNLQSLATVARGAGMGPKIDDFVASMNHAAAPEAGSIFADAVRAMTIDDARKLLTGGDHSITDYFREKTSAQLATAFRPHVEAAMNANGVTKQYDSLKAGMHTGGIGSGIGGLMGGSGNASGAGNFDITTYVVEKALDGLFVMLARQEQSIRTNPAARTTSLLKSVFGKS
jgi:hypothetical protein